MKWLRTTRQHPCRVCHQSGWCTVCQEDGAANCMRVESPVASKNGGWIHKGDAPPSAAHIRAGTVQTVTIDAAGLANCFAADLSDQMRRDAADRLGVTPQSLRELGAGWSTYRQALSFPMHDGAGNVIGIRLRWWNGEKRAIKGSRNGLFLAPARGRGETVYICEGPTDTAALLSLGLTAIGRPQCSGCIDMAVEAIKRSGAARVCILGDSDWDAKQGRSPGIRGAGTLRAAIKSVPCVVVCPPCKDVRKWVQSGARRSDVEKLATQVFRHAAG